MTWAAVGAGAVAIGGSIMSSNSAKKASAASAKTAKKQLAEQRRQFDLTRADNKPWMDRGDQAGNALQQRMGLGADNGSGNYGELMHSFTNADFVKDPGYQFRMDEGAKGLEHSAAARGGLLSGAQAKAVSRYGQDYASNEFGNAYGRYTQDQGNRYNRLQGISQQGQSGAQYLGQAGQANANAMNAIRADQGTRDMGILNFKNASNQDTIGGLGGGFQKWNDNRLAATPKYNMSQNDINNVDVSKKSNSWWGGLI